MSPVKHAPFAQLKDLHMPKLTLTSTFASSIIVGDPSIITITLPAKETKSVEVTDVQLRRLTEGLDKLTNVGWLKYSVADAAVAVTPPAPVVVPPPPPPPPEPVVVPEPVPEPVAPPVEEPAPVPEETPVAAPVVEEAPAPAATKAPFFGKGRNR